MAPPGEKVLIHETPQQRRTWDFHGKEGWYIGTAPLHYQCYRIYIPETRGERITKTVQFYPYNGATPAMSSANAATDVARRLADALANPALASPFSCFGAQTTDAIRKLADIFATTGAQPPNPTPPTRHTRVTVQIPRLKHTTYPQAPPRVPPAVPPSRPDLPVPPRVPHTVPPCRPPRPPPDPPPRVDPPARNPPHRYPLHSCAQANHIVETVGGGSVAFQVVLDPATGKTQGYTQIIGGPDKGTWTTAFSNDIGRLAQGVGNHVKGTNTIFFIHKSKVPGGKRVTYGRIVVSIRPEKAETHQVSITVGGDKISYDGPTATQCTSLITTKILLNSVVSTILALFMCVDIHDFYYNTPMVDFEYMKLPLSMFPQDIIDQYNLKDLVAADGYVYMEIRKGMPGLK